MTTPGSLGGFSSGFTGSSAVDVTETLHPTTRRLFDAIGPGITAGDDGTLLRWLDGVGQLLGAVDDVVRDTGSGVGWSREFDPSLTVSPRWTAQFLGVRIPDSADDLTARTLILDRPSFRRGTPAAIRQAAQSALTGTRTVQLLERDGSAYRLRVQTYDTETPSAAALQAAVLAAKPAGLVVTFQLISATSYELLESETAQTYTALEATAAQTHAALEG